jgi:hypothetical protein
VEQNTTKQHTTKQDAEAQRFMCAKLQECTYRKQNAGHCSCREVERYESKGEKSLVGIECLANELKQQGAETRTSQLFRKHYYK